MSRGPLLLLCLALCAHAYAQGQPAPRLDNRPDDAPQQPDNAAPGNSAAPAESQQTEDPDAPQQDSEEEPPPTTLADARVSFTSLVEAFIIKQSPEGYWPLRDKKTGRLRRLTLISVEPKRLRSAGRNRFKGPASLRDIAEMKTLAAEFTVDLSGTEWRVVGMRILEARKPKRSKKR